jgi:hypothetical protein
MQQVYTTQSSFQPQTTSFRSPLARKLELPSETVIAAILSFTTANGLSLNKSDASAIEREHGLSGDAQFRAGIRSVPSDIGKMFALHHVAARFGERYAYPAPFYFTDKLQMNFPSLSYGFVTPCRYRHGWQSAWLYYRHAKDDKPVWCSGAKFGGAKAQPSIHVCLAENVKRNGVCVLVKDALQAQARARNGAVCFVALNGVMPHTLTAQLRVALPDLRTVLIDLDGITPNLTRALEFAALEWEVL